MRFAGGDPIVGILGAFVMTLGLCGSSFLPQRHLQALRRQETKSGSGSRIKGRQLDVDVGAGPTLREIFRSMSHLLLQTRGVREEYVAAPLRN